MVAHSGTESKPLRSIGKKRATSARSRRDRKSTRLNSNHGYISYAVFCLKKKKNKYTTKSAIKSLQSQQNESFDSLMILTPRTISWNTDSLFYNTRQLILSSQRLRVEVQA